MPLPDATTDFGEIVPPMLWTRRNRVVSDGAERTTVVVVVTGAPVVVVGFGLPAVVDAVALGNDETFGCADFEPLPAAKLATATIRMIRTQAAATIAIRAPGPLAVPGVATIATTLPPGSTAPTHGAGRRVAVEALGLVFPVRRESVHAHSEARDG